MNISTDDCSDDELPEVYLGRNIRNGGRQGGIANLYNMPTAHEVAKQRAINDQIVKELQAANRPKEECKSQGDGLDSDPTAAELVAQVAALSQCPPPAPRPQPALMANVLENLPCGPPLDRLLRLLARAIRTTRPYRVPPEAWDALTQAGSTGAAVLCVAAAVKGTEARRHLHRMMQEFDKTDLVVSETLETLSAATQLAADDATMAARALVEAAEVARSGTGGAADSLAGLLVRRAMAVALGGKDWREASEPQQLVALEAAGRLLAIDGADDEALKLARIAAKGARSSGPDRISVEVTATRLLLLFAPETAPNHTGMVADERPVNSEQKSLPGTLEQGNDQMPVESEQRDNQMPVESEQEDSQMDVGT